MIARFSGDGHMQGPTVRVNPQAGMATAWRGDPPTVVVAPNQTIFVGWTARVEAESGHATDLYLSSSRDHGQTFGAPVKVNDDTKPAVHGMHSLAIGDDGRIYVAWLDERNITPIKDMKMDAKTEGHHMESNRELFVSSSSDGGHTFMPNRKVATDVCPCCKTALAIGPVGRIYLSWRQVLPGDLRHIAVSCSADGGKSFTEPKIVSDDQWVLAGCPVSGSALSVDKDGTLRVLWYSAGTRGQTGLYWSESKDNGSTFSPRRLLSAGLTTGTPVLLAGNKDLTAIWENSENGAARLLTAKVDVHTTPPETMIVQNDGELPAAAIAQNGLVIAYIGKSNQHYSVWVLFARNHREDS